MRPWVLAAAALLAVPASAGAHELQGFVGTGGVDFLARAIPTFVPDRVEDLEFEKVLFTCPGDRPVSAKQRDMAVELEIHSLDIDLPADDRMVVDLVMSMNGNGELDLVNPYACFGAATCNNDFFIDRGHVRVELNVEIEGGKPALTLHAIDLDVEPTAVDFNLSGCSLDGIGNWLIDMAREYALDAALGAAEGMIMQNMSPALAELMVGFSGVQGEIDTFGYDAQLAETDISVAGLGVRGSLDIQSRFPASTCIDEDPGEPASHDGPAPIFDMSASHVGIAANYGLIDDALYHLWRRGTLCFNETTLAGFGLDTHHMMEEIAKILPGFPVGTEFQFEVRAKKPPRVEGSATAEGGITLYAEGVMLDLYGFRPDGTTGSVHVQLDLSMSANIGMNPGVNAMSLNLGEARLERLAIDDQVSAAELGFDPARIRHLANDFIMPAMLEEMSGTPIMAPIFGFAGVYILIRDVELGAAYASAALDLFLAPEDDASAPDTFVTGRPMAIANPRSAIIRFRGEDDQVPDELLQFQVTIDGEAAAPTFMHQAKVGVLGETRVYEVAVAAVDLAGNVDPTPESLSLRVDGIAPSVAIAGSRVRETKGETTIEWIAEDDTTEATNLRTSVEVYAVTDRSDPLSKQLVESVDAGLGARSATVDLPDGELYRVEVVVTDEAGNETRTSLTVRTPGLGGCAAGGGGGSSVLALLMLAVALLRRRTRLA